MDQSEQATEQTVTGWVAAALRGDAEASFRLAEFGWEHDQHETVDSWMVLAAHYGDPAMLWRLADLVKDRTSGDVTARLQRQAIAAEWGGSDVVVDENWCRIYSARPDSSYTQDFDTHVKGEPDTAVHSAVVAAAARFMAVGDDGVEYADPEEALDEAAYSPNCASIPTRHPAGGWHFGLDCKGEVFPLMAATQLRILVEELRRAGATDIRIGTRA
ncbi:hypothetical protein ACFW1A_26315 [Kitasatospora sp. NPDC058965]|uniref:hypothetical protein n=1 Tax=Kitasatospora sp. NPDC058965 TaxID=3346682 RepID=UPI00367FE64E